MKMVALILSMLGLLCLITSALTAFEVIPTFIGEVASLGLIGTNTIFWASLAGLFFLGSISFGVYSIREL